MNTPPTNREEDIFASAAELPEALRPAYLDDACGGDPDLRNRIERMLAAQIASSFMPGPLPHREFGIVGQFDKIDAEKPDDRIGNFCLVEKLGEGGFGTVWLAEQEQPVRRQVALKILKLGMDTREVIARFEQERQALAVMDHPSIAKVFDAGATPSGRPFFAMELVRGTRITDYCDEVKVPTTERLRLFIAVCQAVQHAHQKGIIHRDLKPSNILVTLQDGVPTPKVIDFGVAKAIHGRLTEATITTNLEQLIGTPLYMSPEQAEMNGTDIDTRSDIYSLGVLLYELLTGRTPFTREDLLKVGCKEMRQLICDSEPKKPSTALQGMAEKQRTTVASHRQTDGRALTSQMRGDLDWIVMKALEKDRQRRYETSNGLAMDIRRYLECEPVIARPPSKVYLLSKLIRRHKVGFLATTAVALTLVLGIVGTTVGLMREREAKMQAEAKEKAANASDDISKRELAKTKQTVAFFDRMLEGITPEKAKGRDISLLKSIFDESARQMQTGLEGQPKVEANLQRTLGKAYSSIGLFSEACDHFRRSLELGEKFEPPNHPVLLSARMGIAEALYRMRRLAEAKMECQKVLHIRQLTLPADDTDVLACRDFMARTLAAEGKLAEAEAEHRSILKLLESNASAEKKLICATRNNLAMVLDELGKSDEARKQYSIAREILESLEGADSPESLKFRMNAILTLQAKGKDAEIAAELEKLVPLIRKAFGETHAFTAKARHNYGDALNSIGRFPEAEAELRAVLELRKGGIGIEHPDTVGTRRMLAICLQRQSKYAEAISELRDVLEMQMRTGGPEKSATLRTRMVLADVLYDAKQLPESEAEYRAVVEVMTRKQGAESAETLQARGYLAGVLFKNGKVAESEAEFRAIVRKMELIRGTSDPHSLHARINFGEVLLSLGKLEEAETEMRGALAEQEHAKPDDPNRIHTIERLAVILNRLGKKDEARDYARIAYKARRQADPETASDKSKSDSAPHAK